MLEEARWIFNRIKGNKSGNPDAIIQKIAKAIDLMVHHNEDVMYISTYKKQELSPEL